METDMDKTSEKIIDATMELILECGYAAATTKDIAVRAGVNECTIFRKFGEKKEIVVEGMKLPRWHPNITKDTFADISGDLRADLTMFMENYMREVTPEFVKLSVGLRSPQIYEYTAPIIMNIPQVFLSEVKKYLQTMQRLGKVRQIDIDQTAEMFLSAAFGYVFLSASFGKELLNSDRAAYIESTVNAVIGGIAQ